MYTAMTIASPGPDDARKLTPTAATMRITAIAYARPTGSTPAAMGRKRFVGCWRSASTSRASLMR